MIVWTPVSERLPEPGKSVLAVVNAPGRTYRPLVIAQWIPKFTHESTSDNDSLDLEYDEGRDEFYWPEGWYERIEFWDDYGAVIIDGHVTHWMELPQRPEGRE